MKIDNELKRALKLAWHEETAKNSIERWISICKNECWGNKPENFDLLIRIFGASWYFTRFVFVYGEKAIDLIDNETLPDFSRENLEAILARSITNDDLEINVDQLRLLKNTVMLQILIGFLNKHLSLELAEKALTDLAVATLSKMIEILQRHFKISDFPVTVLGMGRMAGNEMTFGSDLDLIFLYETEDQEVFAQLGRTIRLLLRCIAQPASLGTLYEVDMRLRPHGNSGPLVTTYKTFIEHHSGSREIWERQMMTRCLPVLVMSNNIETIMSKIRNCVYTTYDTENLRSEIVNMRQRVESELGSHKGKFDIKRGKGGIMDIDFISHYFQLKYGREHPSLQIQSTRAVIGELEKLGLVSKKMSNNLLAAYNFLKQTEMCLRLFDLKSIDTFSTVADDNLSLSRAMGHGDSVNDFIEEYRNTITEVRRVFKKLMAG